MARQNWCSKTVPVLFAVVVRDDVPRLILPSFSSFFKWWTRFTLAALCRYSGVSWERSSVWSICHFSPNKNKHFTVITSMTGTQTGSTRDCLQAAYFAYPSFAVLVCIFSMFTLYFEGLKASPSSVDDNEQAYPELQRQQSKCGEGVLQHTAGLSFTTPTGLPLTTGWTKHQRNRRFCPDLIDDLDELHWGKSLSCSILNGCQDLLLSLVPVADVVSDLRASILNHRSVTCTENSSEGFIQASEWLHNETSDWLMESGNYV